MSSTVQSQRIQYTPSTFARSSLLHLTETGTLTALKAHTSARENLGGYLLLVVEDGCGFVRVGNKEYEMWVGDVAFIDCSKPYSHSTPASITTSQSTTSAKTIIKDSGVGSHTGAEEKKSDGLWTISWCHFNGPSLSLIYSKFLERSGKKPTFSSASIGPLLHELYSIASGSSYIRDMQINTLLSSVLEKVMEDCWSEEKANVPERVDLTAIKDYLDQNYSTHITLDSLSKQFFIEKTYLSRTFKALYGINLFQYLELVRINKVKELLRFGDDSAANDSTYTAQKNNSGNVESGSIGNGENKGRGNIENSGGRPMKLAEIAELTGFSSESYLSMRFKKTEGISPKEYREKWR